MELFGIMIDNTSQSAGGKQCIITPEGYTIPLHIRNGLPRMDMSIPTDNDMDKYPHMFITADVPWNPSVLDNEVEEEFFDAVTELPEVQERRDGADPRVDDYGFLQNHKAFEVLFKAQDKFIAQNTTCVPLNQDVFYDASASGIIYYDDVGRVFMTTTH